MSNRRRKHLPLLSSRRDARLRHQLVSDILSVNCLACGASLQQSCSMLGDGPIHLIEPQRQLLAHSSRLLLAAGAGRVSAAQIVAQFGTALPPELAPLLDLPLSDRYL